MGKFADFIELELDADSVVQFGVDVIPGQLQLERYAEAVIRCGRPDIGDTAIEQRVSLRMERQRRMVEHGHRLWVIIDEAALLRPVGGPAVMADQIDHLVRMTRSPGLTIQILPLDISRHASLGVPFTIIKLNDGTEYVYRDGITGGMYSDDADEAAVYREVWGRLQAMALDFDRSVTLMKQAHTRHRSRADGDDCVPRGRLAQVHPQQ